MSHLNSYKFPQIRINRKIYEKLKKMKKKYNCKSFSVLIEKLIQFFEINR